jgi:hypothetical protein
MTPDPEAMNPANVPDDAQDAVLAAPVDFKLGGSLGLQIKEHWRKYRPRMYRELKKTGKLDEAVHAAEAMTVDAYDSAVRSGLNPDQAREFVREEWAFLPDEEDVRRLPSERDPVKLANLPGRSPASASGSPSPPSTPPPASPAATPSARAAPGRTLGRSPQERRPDV